MRTITLLIDFKDMRAANLLPDLVTTALDRYNAQHDFAQYDNDNDGDVDLVTILYAGPRGATGDRSGGLSLASSTCRRRPRSTTASGSGSSSSSSSTSGVRVISIPTPSSRPAGLEGKLEKLDENRAVVESIRKLEESMRTINKQAADPEERERIQSLLRDRIERSQAIERQPD